MNLIRRKERRAQVASHSLGDEFVFLNFYRSNKTSFLPVLFSFSYFTLAENNYYGGNKNLKYKKKISFIMK